MTPTLVYKRTHIGDPCSGGVFGCHDCMGRTRRWKFKAVIGIGGLGREAEDCGIAGKITWIGDGAEISKKRGYRGPLVRFARFRDFGKGGKNLCEEAENLANEMYAEGARAKMRFSDAAQAEIEELLSTVKRCRASSATWPHIARCSAPRCY